MSAHQEFVDQAKTVFSGSTVLYTEDYEAVKGRVLGWVATLKAIPYNLDGIARWRVACEAATMAAKTCPEPYKGWAARLLWTELATILGRLHEVGQATDYKSVDPSFWPEPFRSRALRVQSNWGLVRRHNAQAECHYCGGPIYPVDRQPSRHEPLYRCEQCSLSVRLNQFLELLETA
jgi:hypothetical protein